MIKFIKGNILDSNADALVNTVNTIGVMGKGIALQFKKAFPNNFKSYSDACKTGEIGIGKLLVTREANAFDGDKIIINFPTKMDWRKPSEYSYIEEGLKDLIRVIHKYKLKSIAIPPLGAGNGGLKWEKVKSLIQHHLEDINDIEIYLYEPTQHIEEKLKKERVKLTKARALLLYVLYDLVRNGEYASEFSSEKVAYFLQRFGAKKYFKLDFSPYFYGPYSGKVRFILNALNGSYLMGFSDMDKKPFDPLTLVPDGFEHVQNFINEDSELKSIVDRTTKFLEGFYSDFALELLSSIDYISQEQKTIQKAVIMKNLENWNDRKRSLFNNSKYYDLSIRQLMEAELVVN